VQIYVLDTSTMCDLSLGIFNLQCMSWTIAT
jgi:hypothetical protein